MGTNAIEGLASAGFVPGVRPVLPWADRGGRVPSLTVALPDRECVARFRQMRGADSFLYLLLLDCFQLKIILCHSGLFGGGIFCYPS